MASEVNHDQHSVDSNLAPHNGIGAVFDDKADVDSAVRALQSEGFYGGGVSVFSGPEGLERLDLKGEAHGIVGQVKHAVESLLTDERRFHEAIEAAMKQGKYYLTVQTDGSAEQKERVDSILKAHRAREIRFFGTWATEHL